MESVITVQLALFFIFILLSGFFSSLMTALYHLNKVTMKKIMLQKSRISAFLDRWENAPALLLNDLYVGNNLFKVCAAILGTVLALEIAADWPEIAWWIYGAGMVLIPLSVILLSVILPNTIAQYYPSRVIALMIPVVNGLSLALWPVNRMFYLMTRLLQWILGRSPEAINTNVTEDEIKEIIEAGEQDGAIEETELEMIHSIIEFGDTLVREIMVPRVNMVCVEVSTPMEEILEIMADEKLSRLPVYEQNIDTIVGTLHIKNILNCWRKNIKDMSAIEFTTMPYFVPETKRVSELLKEFQSHHLQMAIVVDEYGGTAGLVTMEDLLEEIVGEIKDEYDDAGPSIRPQDDGAYLVDALAEIDTLNETLGINLPSDEYNTLGGFILWHLRRMPHKNETFEYGSLRITVTEADRKKIHKALIYKLPEPTAPALSDE